MKQIRWADKFPFADAIKFSSLVPDKGSRIVRSDLVSCIISTSPSAAADTIFAGGEPFNLTNGVIFVQSPGSAATAALIKSAELSRSSNERKTSVFSAETLHAFPTSESFGESRRRSLVSGVPTDSKIVLAAVH